MKITRPLIFRQCDVSCIFDKLKALVKKERQDLGLKKVKRAAWNKTSAKIHHLR